METVDCVSEGVCVVEVCSDRVGTSSFGVFFGCLDGSIDVLSLMFALPPSHSSAVTAGAETNSSGNKSS